MGSNREVVVMSAVRTPIGTFGGSLSTIPPVELATLVTREAIQRSGVNPDDVDQVVIGNVIHSEARDMYLSRTAAVKAGVPIGASAFNVNRLCGSGLQAIISAAQAIRLGDSTTAVAGGVECMSRAPYWLPNMRWGNRLNDTTAVDVLVAALTDPFDKVHMGITAENVARKWNISREDQDQLAVESHGRASRAIEGKYFADQIVPVELKSKKGSTFFERDEGPRADTTAEGLAKLKPVFDKEGSVTAGNASSINDAAAAVVLMDQEAASKKGLKPIGKLIDYVIVGVEPKYMGIGPVCAVQNLLKKTGLTLDSIDLFEVNEAFAAQALAVMRDLKLPADRTNPNGSGISLGHPIGATGTILSVKILHELRRTGGKLGLVSMCIGGGQGIAAIFEAVR